MLASASLQSIAYARRLNLQAELEAPECFSQIGSSPELKTAEELYPQFSRLAFDCGFEKFIIGSIPNLYQNHKTSWLIATNLSHFVTSQLQRFLAFERWPVLLKLYHTVAPYFFEEEKVDREYPVTASNVKNLAAGDVDFFSLVDASSGCCIPLITRDGHRAFTLFLTSKNHMNVDIGKLAHEAILLFDTMKVSHSPDQRENLDFGLTVRETECLRWVAAGKTSGEIAQIAGLSEHTVNHYLAGSCRKLDAVNRIQAVVNAVRAGII